MYFCLLLYLDDAPNKESATEYDGSDEGRPIVGLNVNVFGRPFVKRFALCYRSVVLSVCNVRALWPNGWTDQDETWHAGGPRPGHIVLDGDPAPPPPKGHSPLQFSTHVYCGQTAGWMKLVFGMVVSLSSGDFVLDGDPVAPPQKGDRDPKFSAHVYCGQTAGWIKMPLGTKVGLSPGDSVLDGDPAASPQGGGAPSPIFGPFLLWPNGWMHQHATWYGGSPQPRGLWVRWGPSPLPNGRRRPGAQPPIFGPWLL